MRLKYPNINYHEYLPLIVYNVLLVVGKSDLFDVMVMIIVKRKILNIFSSTVQTAMVDIIEARIRAKGRLRCIGLMEGASFYENVIKRLFIGSRCKVWARFLVLLIS